MKLMLSKILYSSLDSLINTIIEQSPNNKFCFFKFSYYNTVRIILLTNNQYYISPQYAVCFKYSCIPQNPPWEEDGAKVAQWEEKDTTENSNLCKCRIFSIIAPIKLFITGLINIVWYYFIVFGKCFVIFFNKQVMHFEFYIFL